MLDEAQIASLKTTALSLCRRGKGILAADESISTIGKRLTLHNLPNDSATRRRYREILICAPGNEEAYSGIILFEETLYQTDSCGRRFVERMREKGIIPGIKVDKGLRELDGCEGETYTSGLGDLESRCVEYYKQGARFAKWRAALRIDTERRLPSETAVERNAEELAEFAEVAQRCGLVPLVEPEILIDGTHDEHESARVAKVVISRVYEKLGERGVVLEGSLLKPMMIVPGIGSGMQKTAEEVATLTLAVMEGAVPRGVPGIMFLSGGMGEEEATRNLAALNGRGELPWRVSFSFGRALQSSVLTAWGGAEERAREAMRVATRLGVVNAQATLGETRGEHPGGSRALYEGFRGWRQPGAGA